MKKVGLVTFHRPINFGAALQAVALYKAIVNCGVDCEIIDYVNPKFEKMYAIFQLPHRFSFKRLLWSIAVIPHNYRKKKGFKKFVSENARLTKPLKSLRELGAMGNVYDVYVTGSDQVWNLQCSGNESCYFLDFVDGKPKNSYAASFGDVNMAEITEYYRKCLLNFSNISVREEVGVEVIQKSIGKPCVKSLDPTLLHDKKQWMDIANKVQSHFKEPYVLVYLVASTLEAQQNVIKLAQSIADKKGYNVVVIGGSLHKSKNAICYVNPESPSEFVALFRDTSYVVTNSFHGTAFSVIFEKNFYSYVNPHLHLQGRVESLLQQIGLEKRVFSCAESINENEIDYQYATKILARCREESLSYLRGIVNEE